MQANQLKQHDQRGLIVLVLLFIGFYLPVIIDLVSTWANDDNYSHGFLIPIIAGYFLWQKKDSLATIEVRASKTGLFFTFVGLSLFIVGNAGAEYFTVGVSLVVTLFGLVYYLFGYETIKSIWFVFFILLFMVPIPSVVYFSAAFPMQLFASKVTAGILELLGIPILRQGNIIHLPNQALEVAEACSGMRSMMSLLAMGAIFGYVTQDRLFAKAFLFLSTIPLAVMGNVLRVLVTALLTYIFEIDTTKEPLHSIMGMIVFLFSLVALAVIGALMKRWIK